MTFVEMLPPVAPYLGIVQNLHFVPLDYPGRIDVASMLTAFVAVAAELGSCLVDSMLG